MIKEKDKIWVEFKCKKCNYEWIPRVKKPEECPKCKKRDWDEDKKQKIKSEDKK